MPDREIAFSAWNEQARSASRILVSGARAEEIARELPGAYIEAEGEGEDDPLAPERLRGPEATSRGPRSGSERAAARVVELLERRYGRATERRSYRGDARTRGGEGSSSLSMGWAVLVRREDRPRAEEALAALIEHRQRTGRVWRPSADATGAPGLVEMRYPRTASVEAWIEALDEATAGEPPDALLIVGGPDSLPFEVEQRLATEYAVGRLDVGDTAEGPFSWAACSLYADKVVRYETGGMPVRRQALLYSFSSDRATEVSHRDLVLPVEADLRSQAVRANLGIEGPECLYDDQATTEALCSALRSRAPAFVMTASHGLEFPELPSRWGALTDSTFVGASGGTPLDASLAKGEAFAPGGILLAFACWSAGIPRKSAHRFFTQDASDDLPLGPRVSPLPRALLAHPNGPVAFVGHVDRATSASFLSSPSRRPDAFLKLARACLREGGTLGEAMESLRARVSPAALQLANALSPLPGGQRKSPTTVMDAWIRFHDILGYVLLGDPALRVTLPAQ